MTQVELTVAGPLDLALWARRFVHWGPDPIVRWDGAHLWCVAGGDRRLVPYRARQTAARRLEVGVSRSGDIDRAAADLLYRIAEPLPRRPLLGLARVDETIARLTRRYRGLRPPLEPDPYASLVTSITAQQVNLAWAVTTRRRLVEKFGRRVRFDGHTLWALPRPEALADVPPDQLRRLQFTWRKAEYLTGVAAAAADGFLDGLGSLPDAAVIDRVTTLRGIGRWSADWLLARCLARPAAVAAGDLGVRKAVGQIYLGTEGPAAEPEVRRVAAAWGDAANWSAHLLLEALARQRPGGRAGRASRRPEIAIRRSRGRP